MFKTGQESWCYLRRKTQIATSCPISRDLTFLTINEKAWTRRRCGSIPRWWVVGPADCTAWIYLEFAVYTKVVSNHSGKYNKHYAEGYPLVLMRKLRKESQHSSKRREKRRVAVNQRAFPKDNHTTVTTICSSGIHEHWLYGTSSNHCAC